ncbi:beta-2-microglobulin-like [Mixophyes fleayi]|uniref:beta-2-microglobulin-like n=1 Tax=Mixophyes fleayi TaxID=3061075 RepID=UPI003F4D8EC8
MKVSWTLSAVVLALVVSLALAEIRPPTVYVYTRKPVKDGEPNQLICYANSFHPPRISMILRRNGEKFKDIQESDLSFQQDWSYHKTVHVPFTPLDGEKYDCAVMHDDQASKIYQLDVAM